MDGWVDGEREGINGWMDRGRDKWISEQSYLL